MFATIVITGTSCSSKMLTIVHYLSIMLIICLLILCARILYLVFLDPKSKRKSWSQVKTLIILGSGGHTAEMLRIISHLNLKNYSPRVYVHARTDEMSIKKVLELEGDRKDYKTMEISRSRKVHQSYLTSVWTTILAVLDSIPVVYKERPELILCNGPGTCVPLCLIAFIFKVLSISQVTIIFVESFCRVKTLSLTGKILYYIADYVIVQWAYLSYPTYRRTVFL